MNAPARGFHPLIVTAVVDETADARSFVLEPPAELAGQFAYRAGQYLTFRIPAGPEPVLRCYSMSSSPHTGEPLRTTVKRVPGGIGSNWLCDHVAVGDVLEATIPAGTFVLADEPGPVVAYGGGSGITPVLSILKTALATTERPVRLLYANRDRSSVIFAAELDELAAAHPERLSVVHHLDDAHGYVTPADVVSVLGGAAGAHVYVCGPTPFMDLVEGALSEAGVAGELILSERFVQPTPVEPGAAEATVEVAVADPADAATTIFVTLNGVTKEIAHRAGDTILDAARSVGFNPPFSCQLGNCATCMARVTEGEVHMRANTALFPEEVAEGLVLTCQGLPRSPVVRVVYE